MEKLLKKLPSKARFLSLSLVIRRFFVRLKTSFVAFITKKPWVSFFLLLVFLFAIIFLSYTLRAPEVVQDKAPVGPKKVVVFVPEKDSIGLVVPAQVKKDSLLEVTALTSGIVSNIYVRPGQNISSGQTLMSLTNDYGSGSTAIEKSIAQNDARLAEEVAGYDKKIQALEERRIKNDATLSGSAEDVELAQLKKDREIRRSTLTTSRLNLALALRNDAVLQPKSTLSGTLTSVSVRRGQFVNSGDTLATLSATGTNATIEAFLSSDTAWLLDPTKDATLLLPSGPVALTLVHLSTQENENGFYSALFSLPSEVATKLTDKNYNNIQLTLTSRDNTILLPLESISEDTESAWVMVLENGMAKTQKVRLGKIFGNYIEIVSGIDATTPVILSRGIIQGEPLTTE